MDRTIFFDGQSVGAEDLNDTNARLIANIKQRTIDFFSKGVIGNKNSIFVHNGANNTVNILPFVAYTKTGERIYVYQTIGSLALDISASQTNPLFKYRLRQQGGLDPDNFGWEINEPYQIYVNYIEKGAKPKVHETTGVFYPTRVNSGFEFYAIPSYTPVDIDTTNMVRLCQVTYDGTQLNIQTTGFIQFATMDASRIYTVAGATAPVSYNPYTQVSLQDHIMCLGSGVPTTTNPHGYTPEDLGFDTVSVQSHEKRMHTSGLTGTQASRTSTSSAFFIEVNVKSATYDNLKLFNLAPNEYLHSNGFWLDSLNVKDVGDRNEVYIQFTYNNETTPTPLPNGVYFIGVNPDSGDIVIGSSISSPENYKIDVTKESTAETIVASVQLVDYETYLNSGAFDIATFKWDSNLNPKPITQIPMREENTRSNFTEKTDERLFGYTSALDLVTTKDLKNNNILKLPYRVVIDDLYLSNGTNITGATTLAQGAIQGLQVKYVDTNKLQVTAGVCRDDTNTVDIRLTNSITKIIDEDWEPAKTGATGGLSNQSGNMLSPFLDSSDASIGLHVFVIMSQTGEIDIAIDTAPNGANINNYAPVSMYIYKRRVGSLFITQEFISGAAGSGITSPYITVEEGTGLWIYYKTPYIMPASTFTVDHWTKAGVPTGSLDSDITFRGRFNSVLTGTSTFHSSLVPSSIIMAGAGVFDVHMSDQSLYVNNYDLTHDAVYCLGYYDSRKN